jgi:hypothetical protein
VDELAAELLLLLVLELLEELLAEVDSLVLELFLDWDWLPHPPKTKASMAPTINNVRFMCVFNPFKIKCRFKNWLD